MSDAIAKLKYAYEHSQMISSREMREELGREFDKLIAEVQAEAWEAGRDAFEWAHKMDHLEPWYYLAENPHREG